MRLLLTLPVALGSMALWLTVAIALTCFGGLASLGPVPPSIALKELIEELVNITQNQKVSACWPGPGYGKLCTRLVPYWLCYSVFLSQLQDPVQRVSPAVQSRN